MTALAASFETIYLPRSKYTVTRMKGRREVLVEALSRLIKFLLTLMITVNEVDLSVDVVALLFNLVLEVDLYIIQVKYYTQLSNFSYLKGVL